MNYTWIRVGSGNNGANETYGTMEVTGARFILKKCEAHLVNMLNGGPAVFVLRECGPPLAGRPWIAGTDWLEKLFTSPAAPPGSDIDLTWDFGEEGLVIPSHTPFNEYRNFGYFNSGLAPAQSTFEMQFNFEFPYGMTGLQLNYLS